MGHIISAFALSNDFNVSCAIGKQAFWNCCLSHFLSHDCQPIITQHAVEVECLDSLLYHPSIFYRFSLQGSQRCSLSQGHSSYYWAEIILWASQLCWRPNTPSPPACFHHRTRSSELSLWVYLPRSFWRFAPLPSLSSSSCHRSFDSHESDNVVQCLHSV